MNLFLMIMCSTLLVSATANLGYNYNQPKPVVKVNIRPQVTATSNGGYPAQQAPPLPAFNIQPQPQPQLTRQNFIAPPPAPAPVRQNIQQQQLSTTSQIYNQPAPQITVEAPQYIPPVQQPAIYAPTFATGATGSTQFQYNQQPQQQTIISKDIYIHSAPEDTDEINISQNVERTPVRKNYRIVFIKAPSQNIRFNVEALKRTQAANEEKTVIYVLSKKPDVTNIQNQLTTIQTESKSHKPEVYFIKYKTQDEANRAQQEIQAQYDALGGSTHISDEGFAPITSVIGGGNLNVGGSGAPIISSGSANLNSFSASSNAGSVGPILGSLSNNGFSSSGSSNFIQAASTNQPQFVQSSNQGSQGSASSVSFAVEGPGTKYLPVKKK